jgi:hypothetical protein
VASAVDVEEALSTAAGALPCSLAVSSRSVELLKDGPSLTGTGRCTGLVQPRGCALLVDCVCHALGSHAG